LKSYPVTFMFNPAGPTSLAVVGMLQYFS
jgi:hypothetical protein